MESNAKVFSSNITKFSFEQNNNLYDLLNVVPAKPVKSNDIKEYTCDFTPKTGKQYESKIKSTLKVRTVADIRKSFEQDVYRYLKSDLETLQNSLLEKIRRGSSKDENTKKLATNILNGDTPISWWSWQMLINLNPEHQKYPRQFVLCNGELIHVNGSIGGIQKKICNYDLATMSQCLPTQKYTKKKLKQDEGNRKKGLFRSSLAVKFKPGPLCKKQFLVNSHQKYQGRNIELINLPKLGLDVQPDYGTALEPPITHCLNHFRKEDGIISQNWAELAVSVLGTIQNGKPVQLNRDCVTFDLAYKHNQNRLLMLRDVDYCGSTSEVIDTGTLFRSSLNEENVQLEVEDMLNKIIDAVEINLTQDTIFTQEQELETFACEDLYFASTVTEVKDTLKRKFCELDRLDVTVATLPETEERNLPKSCSKMYCSLGCICASLEGTHNFEKHCGRVECMFKCTCDFTKDKTGEKTIIGERKNYETSKIHANCHSNTSLENENHMTKNLSIVALKLNCDNIEPWCMVHELYKCFCKGKFTDTCALVTNDALEKESLTKVDCLENSIVTNDSSNFEECQRRVGRKKVKKSKISDKTHTKPNKIHASISMDKTTKTNKITEKLDCRDPEDEIQINRILAKDAGTELRGSSVIINKNADKGTLARQKLRNFILRKYSNNVKDVHENQPNSEDSNNLELWDNKNMSSTRTNEYEGRKYSKVFYRNKNDKISTREKKNKRLQERLSILRKYSNNVKDVHENQPNSEDSNNLELWDNKNMSSTRTNEYEGRKYSKVFYRNKNDKISTREKKNKRLQERLSFLYCYSDSEDDTIIEPTSETKETHFLQLLCDTNKNDGGLTEKSKIRYLPNDTPLVTWLESKYKLYRQPNDSAHCKIILEYPEYGELALHSWSFILQRYRERNNLFLVSQQPPFRIFMTVNTENNFFANCIDLNEIRFVDLDKFPKTVKNLLVNATELNDTFCILRGLGFCWELIGSVTKINERNEHGEQVNMPEINILTSDIDTLAVFSQDKSAEQKDIPSSSEKELQSSTGSSNNTGTSKWFVMAIENDFSEMRFCSRGFFVKYQSIINAIDIARNSEKTVRLTSRRNIEQLEVPTFGIYASASDNEYCVFVGPYEMDDTSGIETIKTTLDVRKLKRTRGYWITTNKLDNPKVVENPLLFALTNSQINSLPIESNFHGTDEVNKDEQEKPDKQDSLHINNTEEPKESSPPKTSQIKIVKPITIRKTNGFYHLAKDGVFKKIQYSQNTTKAMPVVLKTSLNMNDNSAKPFKEPIVISSAKPFKKPIVISNVLNLKQIPQTSQQSFVVASSSAASQIKIPALVSTQNDDPIAKRTNHERSMIILKPGIINGKLVQNKLTEKISSTDNYNINDGTKTLSLLQSGLKNVTIQEQRSVSDPVVGCSITKDTTLKCNFWSDVWIECNNIPNLGWIAGIKNLDNLISFKIPGCDYSGFYPEKEAFTKINSELRKRINILNDVECLWTVHESIDKLQGQEMNFEHLYP